MSGNGMTTAQRRAKSVAAWERRKAEGRTGWTDERRAKFATTMAAKYPKSDHGRRIRAELIGDELPALRASVAALLERVAALEARPALTGEIRLVEWRPDHRRQKDGGQPVRAQRRAVGLPKRPKAAVA
jgi:hypothetical protein